MTKIFEILDILNRRESCKLYRFDNERATCEKRAYFFKFGIGKSGDLEIEKGFDIFDRPLLINGELDKDAKLKLQSQRIVYRGHETAMSLSELLYRSTWVNYDIITPEDRGNITYFDSSLAINQFFQLISSMIEIDNLDTTRISVYNPNTLSWRLIKTDDNGFSNILVLRAKPYVSGEMQKLNHSQITQSLAESLKTFLIKLYEAKDAWEKTQQHPIFLVPDKPPK